MTDDSDSDGEVKKIGFNSEEELRTEYKEFLRDPKNKEIAINYLYESLMEEIIFGTVIEFHRDFKFGNIQALDGKLEDDVDANSIIDLPLATNSKKSVDYVCICPLCKISVGAQKFAYHLEKCMGKGRNSSRVASRRIAKDSKKSSYAYFGTNASDEDDDDGYSERNKKRKRLTNVRSENGNRKYGKPS